MNCKNANKLINRYIDGELSKSQSKELEFHLNSCSNCSKVYSKTKSSLDLLKPTSEIEEQAFYYTRLKQKMEDVNAPKESILSVFLSKKLLQPVIYLSSLILAVYIGILIGSGSSYQNSYSEVTIDEESYIESYAQYQYLNEIDIESIENIMLKDNNEDEN